MIIRGKVERFTMSEPGVLSDLQWTLMLLSYSPYNYVVIFAIFFGLNLSCNVIDVCTGDMYLFTMFLFSVQFCQ